MWFFWCVGPWHASDKLKRFVSTHRLCIIFMLGGIIHLRNSFYKKSKNAMKCLLGTCLFLMLAKTTQACSVCFYGDPTDKMNIALRQGIVALLIVLMVVLGLFIKFFLNVAKRSKKGLKY